MLDYDETARMDAVLELAGAIKAAQRARAHARAVPAEVAGG